VKDRNDLSLGAPVADIVLDELKVEDGRRQIPFKHQGADTEGHLYFCQPHPDIEDPSRSLHARDRFVGRPHGMGEKSNAQ